MSVPTASSLTDFLLPTDRMEDFEVVVAFIRAGL